MYSARFRCFWSPNNTTFVDFCFCQDHCVYIYIYTHIFLVCNGQLEAKDSTATAKTATATAFPFHSKIAVKHPASALSAVLTAPPAGRRFKSAESTCGTGFATNSQQTQAHSPPKALCYIHSSALPTAPGREKRTHQKPESGLG